MSYTFGIAVEVTAEVLPVYAIVREAETTEPGPLRGTVARKGSGVCHVDPQSFSVRGGPEPPGEDGGWPGDLTPEEPTSAALPSDPFDAGLEPGGELEPHQRGSHRRLRRFRSEPRPGVVVGRTRRQEGRLREPSSWEWDGTGRPYLVVRRTVPVVQVALDTGGTARVVDVYAADLEVS